MAFHGARGGRARGRSPGGFEDGAAHPAKQEVAGISLAALRTNHGALRILCKVYSERQYVLERCCALQERCPALLPYPKSKGRFHIKFHGSYNPWQSLPGTISPSSRRTLRHSNAYGRDWGGWSPTFRSMPPTYGVAAAASR